MRKTRLVMSAAIVVTAVGPWIAFWSTMPDEVATHWGVSGDPNGHLPRALALLVLGGVSVALVVAATLQPRAVASPILAFVAGVIASASLAAAWANRDATSWQHAHLALSWLVLGLALGAGAAWLWSREVASALTPPASDRPVLAVSDTEQLAWLGTTVSHPIQLLALTLLVIGGAAVFALPEPAGVITILVGVLVADFATARVTVTRRGVRTSGTFVWPRVTIDADRIASADAREIHPMQWGGWGYRGSLTLMRRAAWIVRKGPGVHLVLKDGKEFVVTIDDADEAAAVVNGIVATSRAR